MNQDRNEKEPKNAVWQVVNDPAEMDDLMGLALRDLRKKFDASMESRFEKILSWDNDYDPGRYESN